VVQRPLIQYARIAAIMDNDEKLEKKLSDFDKYHSQKYVQPLINDLLNIDKYYVNPAYTYPKYK
jgi:hypothetical protein